MRLGWMLIRLLAWGLLAAVAVATLAPIGFRPSSGLPPQAERFAAFFVVGVAFALAYRERLVMIALLVLGSAAALEVLQLATPGRHGMIDDAGAKLAGAACGLLVCWAATALLPRKGGRSAGRPTMTGEPALPHSRMARSRGQPGHTVSGTTRVSPSETHETPVS